MAWSTLFNGTLTGWTSLQGGPAPWRTEHDYLEVVPGTGNIRTEAVFEGFELHIEFWIPWMPEKNGQDRGNSGIFLQGRYEIQVLDSYRNPTYPRGECGALYLQAAPRVNASLPPQQWQSFDIRFVPPRFSREKLVKQGLLNVVHNGERIHQHVPVIRPTGGHLDEHLWEKGPLMLQDHDSPVRFRNIRVANLGAPALPLTDR